MSKEFIKTVNHPKMGEWGIKIYKEIFDGNVMFGIYGHYLCGLPIEDWRDTLEEAETEAMNYLKDIYSGSASNSMAEARATESAEGSGTYGVERYG